MGDAQNVLSSISKMLNGKQCVELQYRKAAGAAVPYIMVALDYAPFYSKPIFISDTAPETWKNMILTLPSELGEIKVYGNVEVQGISIKDTCSSQPQCDPSYQVTCDNGLCINRSNETCSTKTRCGDFSDTASQSCREFIKISFVSEITSV